MDQMSQHRFPALVLLAGLAIAATACTSIGGTAFIATGRTDAPTTAPKTAAPSVAAPPSPAPSTTSTGTGTDHQTQLSAGETAALTAELVAVSGYRYTDLPSADRTDLLAALPDNISAASYH